MTEKCRSVILFALDGAQPRAHYNRLLADAPHSAIYAMDGADGFDRFLEAKPDICFVSDNVSRIGVTILCQLIREHEKGKDVGLFVLSDVNEADERFDKLRVLGINGVRPVLMNSADFATLLMSEFSLVQRDHKSSIPPSAAITSENPLPHIAGPDLVVIDDEDALHSGINSDSIVMQLKPQDSITGLSEIPPVELSPQMQKIAPAEQFEDLHKITSPNPIPKSPETTKPNLISQDSENAQTLVRDSKDQEHTPAFSRNRGFDAESSGIHEAVKESPLEEQTHSQSDFRSKISDAKQQNELTPLLPEIPHAIIGLKPVTEDNLPDISEQTTLKKIPAVEYPENPEEVQEQATPVAEQPDLQWNHDSARLAANGEVFNETAETNSREPKKGVSITILDDGNAAPVSPTGDINAEGVNPDDDLAEAEAAGLLALSDEERDSMTIRQAISGSQLGGRLTRRVLALFRLLDSVDYYQLLGVDINADLEELQQAFHSLALEYHPDRFFSLTDGFIKERIFALFTRICEAYTVLGQRETREHYDAMIASHSSGPPPRYVLGENNKPNEKQRCAAYTPVGRKYLRLAVAAMARGDQNAAQLNLTFALSHEPNNETLRQRLAAMEQGA